MTWPGAAKFRQEFLNRAGTWLREAGLAERRCTACLEPFDGDIGAGESCRSAETIVRVWLCPECRKLLKRRNEGFCPYCGEPSALEDAPCMPCGECLREMPPWSEFLFFGLHEGLLRELMVRAKFGGNLAALDFLGHLLAELCAEHYAAAPLPDAVVPMPLHPRRLRERGFNQCLEFARPVAKRLALPVLLRALEKTKVLKAQASLSREQRKELEQPFEASGDVRGMRILLIDDVCTTGSTLRRATECLLVAGAANVDVAVIARTSRHERPVR